MIGRAMPAWDLDLSTDRSRRWISGAEYAAQKIRQRLQLFKGEWFADRSVGFPWTQDVLKKSPNEELVRSDFRREIEAVPGIRAGSVKVDLVFDYSARNVSGRWSAVYQDGTAIDGSL